MSELSDLLDELTHRWPHARCELHYGPASREMVADAESALGLLFPPSFRNYLQEYAGGVLFFFQIAGVPTEKSKLFVDTEESCIADIVELNQLYRAESDFPESWLYFATDEGDSLFFFDTQIQMDNGENPVVMHGDACEGTGVKVAKDFLQFLAVIANPERDQFSAQ